MLIFHDKHNEWMYFINASNAVLARSPLNTTSIGAIKTGASSP